MAVARYDKMLFRPGEDIFVNRVYESPQPHPHCHDFIEVAYVASGTGLHIIADKEYAVAKGDLFVINYDIPHEFRSLPDLSQPRLYIYNCVFLPRFIDISLPESSDFTAVAHHFLFRSISPGEAAGAPAISLVGSDSTGIEAIYERLYREYTLREDGYIEMLRAHVIELLIHVFRLYRRQLGQVSGEADADPTKNAIVESVKKYLKENYASGNSLQELSAKAFLSYSYLSRLFRRSTGMTISEYLQRVRVEESCRLLHETDMKVADIAGEVGYTDLKSFNRVFRRVTGSTPSAHRKREWLQG